MVFQFRKRGAVGAVGPETPNHALGPPLAGDSDRGDLLPSGLQQQSLPLTASPCRPPLAPAVIPLSKEYARVRSVPTVVTPSTRSGPIEERHTKATSTSDRTTRHRRRRSFDLDLRILRGSDATTPTNQTDDERPKCRRGSTRDELGDEVNTSLDVSEEDGTLGSGTVLGGDGSTSLTVTSLLNDEPSLFTMRAGNLDDATSSVLTSLVCLSLIGGTPSMTRSCWTGPRRITRSILPQPSSSTDASTAGSSATTSASTTGTMLANASPSALVQAGLQRHVRFHLSRILPQRNSLDEDDDFSRSTYSSNASEASLSASSTMSHQEGDDDYEDNDYPSTSSSQSSATQTTESWSRPSQSIRASSHGLDPDEVHYQVYQCLQHGDMPQAIRIYRHLLAKQRFPTHAQRPDTLSRLVVLHLLLGKDYPRARDYATEALHVLQHENNDRPRQVAVKTMELGLVHLAANELPEALKVWKGVVHQDADRGCGGSTTNGENHPPNPHMAILLNNLGVLHFKMGNPAASIQALEESVALLRTSLRQACSQLHVECTIHHMALAMGNLAVVCDETGEQVDRAIALLQESLSLHASVRTFDNDRMDQVVQSYMDRLVQRPTGNIRGSLPADGLSGSNGCRSLSLFGNLDGITSASGGAPGDSRDFWLLGSPNAELKPEQVARAAILTWFGKQPDVERQWCGHSSVGSSLPERLPIVSPDPPKRRSKASIPVDLDGDAVVNAEQHLHEIHRQVLEHVEHDEFDDALDVLASALKSHRSKYGECHLLVGRTLHNMGLVQLLAGRCADAQASLVQAICVRSAALGSGNAEVRDSQAKLALVQLTQGDLRGACSTLSEVRDGLPNARTDQRQHAAISNNLGVLQYWEGDLKGARSSFLASCNHLNRTDEADASIARAHALSNLGLVCTKLEDVSSALIHAEEALAVYEQHLAPDDPRVRVAQVTVDFHGPRGWIDHTACQMTSGRLCFGFA